MASAGFRPLAKLVIISADGPAIPFVAMYNPTTMSITHSQTLIEKKKKVGGTPLPETSDSQNPLELAYPDNPTFNVELFFDGTGASPPMGISTIGGAIGKAAGLVVSAVGVEVLIDAFLSLAFKTVGTKHESRRLKLIWGAGFFLKCRVVSATVNYTLINRLGLPLRATVAVSFMGDTDPKFASIANLFSPDLTKTHVVKAGDTLYNIAKEEYDDESFYLQIAQANDLKNYRKLIPGQTLILPPIKQDEI